MANAFIEGLAKEGQLQPIETAVLQAAGVRSIADVHSLVQNFPSIHKAGVRVPLLSSMASQRVGQVFANLAAEVSTPAMQRSLVAGAAHPPKAQWPLGAAVPVPPGAGPGPQPSGAPSGLPPPTTSAGKIDLRVTPWPVRNQGQRGTCVAFASSACAEVCKNVPASGAPTDLSEQFLYWSIKTNTSDPNPKSDGTYLEFARDALASGGICRESLWPYVGIPIPGNVSHAARTKPSNPAIKAAQRNPYGGASYQVINHPGAGAAVVLAALKRGYPVAVTLPVFSDPAVPNGANNWTTGSGWAFGRVLDPPPTAIVSDGHAVCVVGFEPDAAEPKGGYFVFRNSWDTVWARQAPVAGYCSPEPGYGDISATYIDLYLWEMLQL